MPQQFCCFRRNCSKGRKLPTASIEAFSKVIRTTSRHRDICQKALLERAKTYLADNQKSKAKKDLEKIVATDFENPGVRELLKNID